MQLIISRYLIQTWPLHGIAQRKIKAIRHFHPINPICSLRFFHFHRICVISNLTSINFLFVKRPNCRTGNYICLRASKQVRVDFNSKLDYDIDFFCLLTIASLLR